jgi:DNA-binding NtrC family response regulator
MPEARRFLVLERDPDLRFFYSRDLRQAFPGCAVVEAESCQAALASLTNTSIDAAIVNQAATDAKGPEMLRRLHAQHPDLTLISIGESALKKDALQAGASAFVEAGKSQQLGSVVREVLKPQPKAAAGT